MTMTGITLYPIPDVVVRGAALVGEGPVWDDRTDSLCWVDLDAGLLMEEYLAEPSRRVSKLGTMVGAVAPRREADGFAVAVAEGFGFWEDDALTIVDHTFRGLSRRRMNDAKCDSSGRLWAGSTHVDYLSGLGALHRWDGSPSSTTALEGLTLPNGMGWSPDDRVMYLVDSIQGRLMRAVFDPDEGVVRSFETVCKVDGGLPDGLAVDVEGCIWVAVWGGAEVRRFDPEGRQVGAVRLPVSQPSSCAFGPDGTLYITSASRGLTDLERLRQPLAGSLFALTTNVTGVPVHPFAG